MAHWQAVILSTDIMSADMLYLDKMSIDKTSGDKKRKQYVEKDENIQNINT